MAIESVGVAIQPPSPIAPSESTHLQALQEPFWYQGVIL
jgi:hypothetical protein